MTEMLESLVLTNLFYIAYDVLRFVRFLHILYSRKANAKGANWMAYKYLVIVESPAKAKTIEKYLGRNYKVVASVGHISN